MSNLFELVEKYGTDKTLSGYTNTYSDIFKDIKDKVTSVLEIGIGTLNCEIPSTFIGNKNIFEQYEPGGSLRVWRDYFQYAQIFGVDIAKDCMFKEERINTFLFDSSEKEYVDYYLDNLTFDIIIDDGNHDPKFQIKTLKNLLGRVKEGGYYIIEDIGGYSGTEELLVDYLEEFNELTKNYFVENRGNHIVILKKYQTSVEIERKDMTIVSGLWNISREGRNFEEHYLPNFKEFLKTPANMFLFLPKELHSIVWEIRDKKNTFVKEYELEDIKKLYQPHWNATQKIRKSKKWLNITGEDGWLKNSPQAKNEWYNPIVQSKLFMMHEACIWNPFSSEYFYWVDAGLTNTVPSDHLVNQKILNKLPEYSKPFLFLSYPYEANNEIHGFDFSKINELAGSKVNYVCRGGLFGGHIDQLKEANSTYYGLLSSTLNEGYMGTEESLFTIMSYNEPEYYKRYLLDGNGLIVKFTQAIIDNNVNIEEPVKKKRKVKNVSKQELNQAKTNLYMLTFNFPEQILHTLESMKKTPEWLQKPKLFLLDNSTDKKAKKQNKKIAKEHNFTYIDLKGNTGINGGRQAAAEHFDKSDADFMLFFEDDMTSNPPETNGQFCRNGFRKYIPNLYTIIHKIMISEGFDFLKLSYTEVFMDNNIQVSWYNVPQEIRSKHWPDYDKLPVNGLDPNAPRTEFKTIEVMDGVSYITGDIYYANWPMIVSKEGNRKMFIETKWDHPYEQTWMSYMYQKTKEGYIKPAVLLASPIWHDRIKHYKPEERREN